MCGVLTRIVVTCTDILTSVRSTLGYPLRFSANRTLSYRVHSSEGMHTRNFGTTFNPDHLRRKDSRLVSCYAFFKGWLLLSQPPNCL
jgi:hypothetical protein